MSIEKPSISLMQKTVLINFHELPVAAQREYDWADSEEDFFEYRGDYYALADFMCVDHGGVLARLGWDGYASDSYFSGKVIKCCQGDNDALEVATYIFRV